MPPTRSSCRRRLASRAEITNPDIFCCRALSMDLSMAFGVRGMTQIFMADIGFPSSSEGIGFPSSSEGGESYFLVCQPARQLRHDPIS